MSWKRVNKESLIGSNILFDTNVDSQIDMIEPSFAMNNIDIISLDGLNGNPVTPTAGVYKIYVRTDVDGGFKLIDEHGLFEATKTGGSGLSDGIAVGASFVGFPLEFKIVPVGVNVAVAYRVDIKQSSVQIGRSVPLETSNRDNVGVPVFIQDQTTDSLSVPFLLSLGSISLAANTVVDQRFITLNSGHSVSTGEWIELAKIDDNTFMQALVVGVVGDVIELDSLINHIYLTTDVIVRSTNNLLVDGSATPQIFNILPLPTQAGDMVRVIWNIESSASMDFSTFGGAAALTNGCLIRINHGDGTYKNNFKSNGDIIEQCFDHTFLSPLQGNTTKGFTARLTWGGPSKHGVVIRVEGLLNESLELVVQDDLTGSVNSTFTLRGQGHEIQGNA